jgi:hypothetical protein
MFTDFDSALDALPAVASSPLAFAAYAIIIAAWVILGLKTRRNKGLLQHLDKFPEYNRLAALEAEIGHVRITGDMTAEQWIRSRIHLYYLIAFAITCLTLIALVAIASVRGQIAVERQRTADLGSNSFSSPLSSNVGVAIQFPQKIVLAPGEGLPAERPVRGNVVGFTREEIQRLGLHVEIFIRTDRWYPQGTSTVRADGSWGLQKAYFAGSIHDVRAVLWDHDGNERGAAMIKVPLIQ